jgi:DNA-binding response OmpR family regulator
MDRVRTTALVVDDDVCVRSLLAELLVEEGFDVSQASNGFSGLRLATEHQPQVILLDLVLPELSGQELLRELREHHLTRDAAIVIVSGNAETLSDKQIAEVDAVVRKPFDVSALVATLRQALQRAAHRAAEVAPVWHVDAHDGARGGRRSSAPRRTRGRRL